MTQAQFPGKFRCLFQPKRYKVFYGGRGSAKSHSVARALLILAAKRRLRVLCAREFQNSIRESVHKLLSDQIEALRLGGFYQVQQTSIVGANGSEFIFEGLRLNTNKIKSMEGIDVCWVEEAQTVSKASWELLIPTIRADGSEIWVTFNPDLEEDETYQRFIVHPYPNSFVVEVNWHDNPWFPEVLRVEKDHLLSVDIDAYENIYGGKCRRQVIGALWTKELLNAQREPAFATEDARQAFLTRMQRIVIAVDPSGAAGKDDERSDEIGIVAAGLGHDGIGRVLEDASGRYSPDGWANESLRLHRHWKADRIIAEQNFGGAMVESTIRTARSDAPVRLVTASRGKVQRAEPVAALYEQAKVRHVGHFPELERQMTLFSTAGYKGKRSPDRADAAIWALTELMVSSEGMPGLFVL